ncbi:MAG: DUF3800 domain-containing protein [Candidatus Lindowbacteria bacterium]|nr:DUF3800 domain-containing protein [Candidatus Lindowbacteria bacterium]
MWWLYLDESGDLGFDFVNKRPSRFFTVCVLATNDRNAFKRIGKAVNKTLRKINKRKKTKIQELKGNNTTLESKLHFYRQVENGYFAIYTVTLDKRTVPAAMSDDKSRVYNWIARQALVHIPFHTAESRVQLVMDKCKNKRDISDFNDYIAMQVSSRLDPRVPLQIAHLYSHEDRLLQAVDMFAWGIFRRYEREDLRWYAIFKDKIAYDELHLT